MESFKFNFLEIVVNNSCPLDCSYCFLENRGEVDNMSTETLVNIFNFCKEHQIEHNAQRGDFISIVFALKEPMLHWNRIRAALDSLGYDLREYYIFITINTNGVLITDEILDYCADKHIDLHISLDGPKDIHDRGRKFRGDQTGKSSFDAIMELIDTNIHRPLMSYMTTIHSQDIDRITEIFNFMSNLPIHCWVYALNKFDDWSDENIRKLEAGIKAFINQASPTQIKRTRIVNTAAVLPNLNVINSLKFLQDGSAYIQPPTPNDGAQQGEFTSKVYLGNINTTGLKLPKGFADTDFSTYEIIGEDCSPSCPVYTLCKRGSDKKIYVDKFTCTRLQHFQNMAKYAKGGNMTEKEYQEIRKQTPIYNAVINVTDNCNLRCPYCFTEHNTRVIDMGTMKAGIGFIISEIKRFKDFHGRPSIAFFGGEPMLHFEDIIVPTVEWCKSTGLIDDYNLSFNMTTNGTLLTKDRLRWLSHHRVNILLSIDGDKETQDSQRPGVNGGSSFDQIVDKIPNILRYFPNVTFRSAIEPFNAHLMIENYLFARRNNFKNYFITPNLSAEWTLEQAQIAVGQLALIAAVIMRDVSLGIPPLLWGEFSAAIKSVLLPIQDDEISFNHCGIGTVSVGIAANGDLNGCQEHNTYLEHDIFHIGDIFTGIDSTKHRRLLSAYKETKHPICSDMPELCKTCSFYNNCAHHFCPSHNLGKNNRLIENPLVACLWKKSVRDIASAMIIEIAQNGNERQKTFIEDICLGKADYSVW